MLSVSFQFCSPKPTGQNAQKKDNKFIEKASMGSDMIPMGKPKPGFEKCFVEIFEIFTKDNIIQPAFLTRIMGKKYLTKDELLHEWLDIQIQTYETIKSPRVGETKKQMNGSETNTASLNKNHFWRNI